MQRPEAQRLHRELREVIAGQCPIESQRNATVITRPLGNQNTHRLGLEAADDELQHPRRGGVEPLRIVDGDQGRARRRQRSQAGEKGECDGSRIERALLATSEQSDVEGVTLRGRQGWQYLVQDAGKKIRQRGVGPLRLDLSRTAREHPEPRGYGLLERPCPDGRLADAGLSLQEERAGSVRNGVEKRGDAKEFVAAPIEGVRRRGRFPARAAHMSPPTRTYRLPAR